jgi:hypothetical protein
MNVVTYLFILKEVRQKQQKIESIAKQTVKKKREKIKKNEVVYVTTRSEQRSSEEALSQRANTAETGNYGAREREEYSREREGYVFSRSSYSDSRFEDSY